MLTPDPADHTTDHRVVTIGRGGSLGPPISKEVAHVAPGILHLAVSVQAVDPAGRWLLQRRAASKSAFADRWANTCSTHPRPGETPEDAAIRRLGEETGLVVRNLLTAGVFVYRATDPASGLVEHEVDHVFVAIADTGWVSTNPAVVADLVRLTFCEAHRLVSSDRGAPWAAEVLSRSFDILERRYVATEHDDDAGKDPRGTD